MAEGLLQQDGTGPLSERIYARVLEGILRGDFGQGGKLPTEGELAEHFGSDAYLKHESMGALVKENLRQLRAAEKRERG